MAKIKVPMELKANYLRDPENFLRDIACIPTESTRPFIKDRSKIDKVDKAAYANPFLEDKRSFITEFGPEKGTGLHTRYMHIDLGLKKDAVGISMCHASHFVERQKVEIEAFGHRMTNVRLPFIKFDFLGRVSAAKGEEILLSDIREIIYQIQRLGFYIGLITFDGFQSVDSIQILRNQGFRVGRLSIDRTSTKLVLDKRSKTGDGLSRKSTEGQTMAAMQALKDALYDERLAIPVHEYWKKEAVGAEIDYKKNKVDHKPRGTIDLLQSMAGSVYNLVNNEREYTNAEDNINMGTEDNFGDELEFDDSYMYN